MYLVTLKEYASLANYLLYKLATIISLRKYFSFSTIEKGITIYFYDFLEVTTK